jgi:DNA modification methylase
MSFRRETLAEGVEVWLGDAREILPTLGRFDAVVTDPPYGIGADSTMHKQSGTQYGKAAAAKREYRDTGWDVKPIPPELMILVQSAAKWNIIFGGNYYSFPASSCWLVWDKENGDNGFADCELAWTNLPKAVRRIKWMWNGMLRKGGEAREGHPTQKPVEVMRWAIGQLPEPSLSILDPFCGSGTTGMAAVSMGKRFTGIEIDPIYFELACERITRALQQPDLLVSAPPKPIEQTSMFSEDAA